DPQIHIVGRLLAHLCPNHNCPSCYWLMVLCSRTPGSPAPSSRLFSLVCASCLYCWHRFSLLRKSNDSAKPARRIRVTRKTILFFQMLIAALILAAGICRAESINLGYSGTGVSGTLRGIIEKEKLWQKRGLDVHAIYFNSGNVLSQAVVAGDI